MPSADSLRSSVRRLTEPLMYPRISDATESCDDREPRILFILHLLQATVIPHVPGDVSGGGAADLSPRPSWRASFQGPTHLSACARQGGDGSPLLLSRGSAGVCSPPACT